MRETTDRVATTLTLAKASIIAGSCPGAADGRMKTGTLPLSPLAANPKANVVQPRIEQARPQWRSRTRRHPLPIGFPGDLQVQHQFEDWSVLGSATLIISLSNRAELCQSISRYGSPGR
jgi:hypothetical protein